MHAERRAFGEAGLVLEGEELERFRRDLEHLLYRLGFSRLGNNLKGWEEFYLKTKARIWPWLSYICHVWP